MTLYKAIYNIELILRQLSSETSVTSIGEITTEELEERPPPSIVVIKKARGSMKRNKCSRQFYRLYSSTFPEIVDQPLTLRQPKHSFPKSTDKQTFCKKHT